MNSDFEIYKAEYVSDEDKARLDGFLKGHEESDLLARLQAEQRSEQERLNALLEEKETRAA